MNRTAPLLLALLLTAAPAFAQDPERDLYESAKKQWELELRPEVRAELQPRWSQLDAQLAKLNELVGQLGAQDPRRVALNDYIEKQKVERMQGSGTLRGSHGNVPGTNGAEIGARNFRKADALISEWAKAGLPMTVERLQEINKVLGTDLQHNGRPPGTIQPLNRAASSRTNRRPRCSRSSRASPPERARPYPPGHRRSAHRRCGCRPRCRSRDGCHGRREFPAGRRCPRPSTRAPRGLRLRTADARNTTPPR